MRWDGEEYPSGAGFEGGHALLVSLHFMRNALLRRWRTVTVFVAAGVLLALAALVLLPPERSATTSLVLAHPDGEDSVTAMATDVSFLRTRAVAQQVIDDLGLSLTPDEFQASVDVVVPTPQIVSITVRAATASEALRRANALDLAFLDFRSRQLRLRSDGVIAGDQKRIAQLQEQSRTLTEQYEAVVGQPGASSQARAGDILTQRSQLDAEVTSLQADIQQSALETESILLASHVVDVPAVDPAGTKRRLMLVMASGLIGSTAVGVGLVLVVALLSSRLRRRAEIATASGLPVLFSAGSLRSRSLFRRRMRIRNLAVLAAGLETAVATDNGPTRLSMVCVGCAEEGAAVMAAAAERRSISGSKVFLIDLTERGVLSRIAASLTNVPCHRPTTTPEVSGRPLALVSSHSGRLPADDPHAEEFDRSDVALVLAEADLGVGTGPVSSWSDEGVLLVRAGAASAELLVSIARVFRASSFPLKFAMLVGADRTDESAGLPRTAAAEAPARRSS